MSDHAETKVQIKDKFCLTVDEAAEYFGICQKKLRKLISDNRDSGIFLENGVKYLIKRKKFEQFLDSVTSI